MKYLIYISIFLCAPFFALAQDSLHVAVPVAYVNVNGDSQIHFSSDSVQLAWNNSTSMGELLRNQANFISRSYGARGTAVTASGQGLSANQFTATWNGFELNSPTLGTVDLGILSPAMFSSLKLNQHSFGTSPAQSSGAGGWLELNTQNRVNEVVQVQLNANSIGNQSGTLILPYQINRLQLVTRVNYVHALNEFEYTDELRRVHHVESNSWDHPTLIQDHNNHEMISLIQGASFLMKDWLLDGQVWYQNSRTSLPEIKGSFGQSFAEQSDSSLRATISAKGSLFGVNSHFSLARFEESQRYIDRQSENGDLVINSKIETKVLAARAHFKGEWKSLNWGALSNFMKRSAESANYHATLNPSQNVFSQSVQLGASKGNTSINANARFDFLKKQHTEPVIDAVAIQGIDKKGKLRLRAAYSRMFRLPTFNELFWHSETQRNLNSEKGEKATLGFDGDLEWKKIGIRFDANVSHTKMGEMIQWSTFDGVSTPFNTGQFTAGNLSGRLELQQGAKLKKLVSYQVNVLKYLEAPFWISNMGDEIEPSLRQNITLNLSYKKWTVLAQSSSRKNDLFPGAEPRTLATPVVIHNIGLGYQHIWKQNSIQTQVLLDNVLDTPNHFLRAFAMPGRVLKVNLIFKRIPKKQSK